MLHLPASLALKCKLHRSFKVACLPHYGFWLSSFATPLFAAPFLTNPSADRDIPYASSFDSLQTTATACARMQENLSSWDSWFEAKLGQANTDGRSEEPELIDLCLARLIGTNHQDALSQAAWQHVESSLKSKYPKSEDYRAALLRLRHKLLLLKSRKVGVPTNLMITALRVTKWIDEACFKGEDSRFIEKNLIFLEKGPQSIQGCLEEDGTLKEATIPAEAQTYLMLALHWDDNGLPGRQQAYEQLRKYLDPARERQLVRGRHRRQKQCLLNDLATVMRTGLFTDLLYSCFEQLFQTAQCEKQMDVVLSAISGSTNKTLAREMVDLCIQEEWMGRFQPISPNNLGFYLGFTLAQGSSESRSKARDAVLEFLQRHQDNPDMIKLVRRALCKREEEELFSDCDEQFARLLKVHIESALRKQLSSQMRMQAIYQDLQASGSLAIDNYYALPSPYLPIESEEDAATANHPSAFDLEYNIAQSLGAWDFGCNYKTPVRIIQEIESFLTSLLPQEPSSQKYFDIAQACIDHAGLENFGKPVVREALQALCASLKPIDLKTLHRALQDSRHRCTLLETLQLPDREHFKPLSFQTLGPCCAIALFPDAGQATDRKKAVEALNQFLCCDETGERLNLLTLQPRLKSIESLLAQADECNVGEAEMRQMLRSGLALKKAQARLHGLKEESAYLGTLHKFKQLIVDLGLSEISPSEPFDDLAHNLYGYSIDVHLAQLLRYGSSIATGSLAHLMDFIHCDNVFEKQLLRSDLIDKVLHKVVSVSNTPTKYRGLRELQERLNEQFYLNLETLAENLKTEGDADQWLYLIQEPDSNLLKAVSRAMLPVYFAVALSPSELIPGIRSEAHEKIVGVSLQHVTDPMYLPYLRRCLTTAEQAGLGTPETRKVLCDGLKSVLVKGTVSECLEVLMGRAPEIVAGQMPQAPSKTEAMQRLRQFLQQDARTNAATPTNAEFVLTYLHQGAQRLFNPTSEERLILDMLYDTIRESQFQGSILDMLLIYAKLKNNRQQWEILGQTILNVDAFTTGEEEVFKPISSENLGAFVALALDPAQIPYPGDAQSAIRCIECFLASLPDDIERKDWCDTIRDYLNKAEAFGFGSSQTISALQNCLNWS